MKRIMMMIMAVISLAINVIAQENAAPLQNRVNFGLKAGTNYSNVYDIKGDGFVADGKFGLAGGAFISIPIGPYFGIQPEILYSQKGFRATGEILGVIDYEFTHTTSYIDVPLLFAFKPVGILTLLVGPQVSFLVKQKDEMTNSSITQEFPVDNLRKNTFCFLGGADINLNKIVLGLRAGWDIQDNNGDGTVTSPRYKNVWYQATLGFKF
jgi:cellobiose-specific phosphotransferase system component IIB